MNEALLRHIVLCKFCFSIKGINFIIMAGTIVLSGSVAKFELILGSFGNFSNSTFLPCSSQLQQRQLNQERGALMS